MENERKDGGPAFPYVLNGMDQPHDPGMTLRDWFAGQAINGLVSRSDTSTLIYGKSLERHEATMKLACVAYTIADAMIAERDQP